MTCNERRQVIRKRRTKTLAKWWRAINNYRQVEELEMPMGIDNAKLGWKIMQELAAEIGYRTICKEY